MTSPAAVRDRLVELLRSTSSLMSVSRHLDEVLEAITRGVAENVGETNCQVWLYRRDDECERCAGLPFPDGRTALHFAAGAGPGIAISERQHRVELGQYLVGRVAERRLPMRLDGFTAAWKAYQSGSVEPPFDIRAGEDVANVELITTLGGVGASLHPLLVREELVGVLGVWSRRAISDDEAACFELFAGQAAIAIKTAELFTIAERARQVLELENAELREASPDHLLDEFAGESAALGAVLRDVRQVAPTDATVLILGETGTGKERLARLVHQLSPRRDRPMVAINCGAIAPGVAESELFGHERGAFTGASQRRIGRFELAHRGTLFMDEVGELTPELQAGLLRTLQEREIERVGGTQKIRVDVRLIAATNRDLDAEVAAGRFRSDLFYRLNVVPIRMPALRERRDDIAPLATTFLDHFARRLRKPLRGFTPATMRRLEAYAWPGNVRELENFVERLCVLATGPLADGDPSAGLGGPNHRPTVAGESLRAVERQHIERTLEAAGGRIEGAQGAAARLGLAPSTLRARMRRLGLRRDG
jgi:transcriptional regulator with GAF, ATPase, and Fis domain